MAKLILSMDGLVLKEIQLAKERTTIGRKAHNDIQIDNLAISGEHAAIVTILNDSFLEDLNSTNGTYVNGQPIKKHFLQHNDVVELGKYRLKYINEAASPNAAMEMEKTLSMRPDVVRQSEEQLAQKTLGDTHVGLDVPAMAEETEAPLAAAPLGAVQILSGANTGRELELAKSLTTLGKPGVQVAVITRRPQGYFITHVEGKDLPVVNGRSLDAQAHPLRPHDVIEIAGVKMEFFLRS
jgi:pSer/pThr/pTyr-binding forkhead associated (FHA) protein